MKKISRERFGVTRLRKIYLRGTMMCETINVEVSFHVQQTSLRENGNPMLFEYSMYRSKKWDCYSFILKRDPGVSAFLEPFGADVWILTFSTMLLLARISSWLKLNTSRNLLARTMMSFITGIHIGAQARRYSHLLLLGGRLFFVFLLERTEHAHRSLCFSDQLNHCSCAKGPSRAARMSLSI